MNSKEVFEQKRRASTSDPRFRWLTARHRELAQGHTKAAQAAENMDITAYGAALRGIAFSLKRLNEAAAQRDNPHALALAMNPLEDKP